MDDRTAFFEQALWPHARAAFNFARWMVRNDHDAEDIAQESLLKALGAIHTFRGGEPRPWLLAIVRNTAITYMQRKRPAKETEWNESAEQKTDGRPDPEHRLIEQSRRDQVRAAIAGLPPEFREALVLREIEGLAYKEIGFILKIPMGTVMSRLSRARQMLAQEILSQGAQA